VWLVAGLGNPGSKYAANRHNIGFMVVDELSRRAKAEAWKSKFGGDVTLCEIAGQRTVLLKPMEYMNVSGRAVQRVSAFYQVEPRELIVVHDEIDLPFGRLRLKAGGGHGGHNGLRSIVEQLGHSDFLRVRIGVGKPEREGGGAGDGRVANHVLSDFPAAMDREVDELMARSADAVEAILARGIRTAMNEFNGDEKQKKAD
jgi:PTH1 family peptidyl-tRNA hydrolase